MDSLKFNNPNIANKLNPIEASLTDCTLNVKTWPHLIHSKDSRIGDPELYLPLKPSLMELFADLAGQLVKSGGLLRADIILPNSGFFGKSEQKVGIVNPKGNISLSTLTLTSDGTIERTQVRKFTNSPDIFGSLSYWVEFLYSTDVPTQLEYISHGETIHSVGYYPGGVAKTYDEYLNSKELQIRKAQNKQKARAALERFKQRDYDGLRVAPIILTETEIKTRKR